jgi:hypothetical protein
MFSFVTGDGLGSVDTGTGPRDPHYIKGMKINPKKIHQSTILKTGLFILMVLIFFQNPW